MIFSDVIEKIDRGREGLNTGLSMGFERLVEHIPGIQQGTYYLIGGETGSGKTAFTDSCFLYNPYDWIKANPDCGMEFEVFYWSLEIDKTIKITKAICRKLYLDYGILTDINFVLSRGKNRISQEVYDTVKVTKDYFCGLEDCLTIIDAAENPTGIYKFMNNYARDNGDILYKKIQSGTETISVFDKYIPYNPDKYVLIVIDHIALMKRERGFNQKDNIDKMSEYLIPLRNNFNFIPVVVQQLGRAMSQTDRFKLDRVEPQLSDFKDSGNTQQDANVVLSLFSPRKYEIENFRGYNIVKLKDRYRSLSILKNRDGAADIRIGLQFVGEVGHFEEVPPAKQFKEDPSLYDKVIDVNNKNNNK
jgi:replicative DNA helicase